MYGSVYYSWLYFVSLKQRLWLYTLLLTEEQSCIYHFTELKGEDDK